MISIFAQICLQRPQPSSYHSTSEGSTACWSVCGAGPSHHLHAGCSTCPGTEADAGRTFDPTHPNTAFKAGWKDEGNVAGNRRLPAAVRAIGSQADEAVVVLALSPRPEGGCCCRCYLLDKEKLIQKPNNSSWD